MSFSVYSGNFFSFFTYAQSISEQRDLKDPTKDPQYSEPQIDAMRAQKDQVTYLSFKIVLTKFFFSAQTLYIYVFRQKWIKSSIISPYVTRRCSWTLFLMLRTASLDRFLKKILNEFKGKQEKSFVNNLLLLDLD